MTWILAAVFVLPPLLAFAIVYRISRGRWLVATIAAGVANAALGAFFASAGSAMATSVDPRVALIRGAAIGFSTGCAVGGTVAAILAVRRRA